MNRRLAVAALVLLAAGLGAGLLTGATASSTSAQDQLLQSYGLIKQSSYYASYKKGHASEAAAVDAYWSNGGSAPSVSTLFGQGLLLEGQAYWGLNSPSPATTTTTTTTAPSSADTTPPSVPANVRVTGVTVSTVSLAWDPSTDNVGVAGYNVYKNGTVYPDNWVASVPQGTTYTVTGLTCGSSYTFYVTAYDAAGNASAPSQAAPALTSPCAASSRWYAANSPWNTPVAANPAVDPNSLVYVNLLNAWAVGWNINSDAYTSTVYYTDASTPRHSVSLSNNYQIDNVPIPDGAVASPGSDLHAMFIDQASGCEYDFIEFGYKPAVGGVYFADGEASFKIDSGSGVHQPWSAKASGFALGGGLIRPEDVKTGVIDHALVFAAGITAPSFVAPATTSDGRTLGGLPMGTHLQLDPALNLDTFQPPLSNWQKMLARALQKYGMYLGDTSSSLAFYAVSKSSGAWVGTYPWEGQWFRNDLIPHMRAIAPDAPPALDTWANPACSQRYLK